MITTPEHHRRTAERDLAHWGIELTEAYIRHEIERIVERLDRAFVHTDARLGVS